MLTQVQCGAVLRIDACAVHVEVDVGNGLPMMAAVGLRNAAVNESGDGAETLYQHDFANIKGGLHTCTLTYELGD